MRRRRAHRPEVLDALLRDLEAVAPDHVAITGDLTNVSLEAEFPEARSWLQRVGPPDRVTLVPGNHDAYVRVAPERAWALWSEYLAPDAAGAELLAEVTGREETGEVAFPSLRLVRGVAIVGLCSALPTGLLSATGRLGRAQLAALEALLRALGERGLPRVLLLHHPPAPGVVHPRRALTDAEPLCDVLRRVGAELVLHGHLHRTHVSSLPGPASPIAVVGVRSASHAPGHADKVARYHVYEIGTGPRPKITLQAREYDAASGGFRDAGPPEDLPA